MRFCGTETERHCEQRGASDSYSWRQQRSSSSSSSSSSRGRGPETRYGGAPRARCCVTPSRRSKPRWMVHGRHYAAPEPAEVAAPAARRQVGSQRAEVVRGGVTTSVLAAAALLATPRSGCSQRHAEAASSTAEDCGGSRSRAGQAGRSWCRRPVADGARRQGQEGSTGSGG